MGIFFPGLSIKLAMLVSGIMRFNPGVIFLSSLLHPSFFHVMRNPRIMHCHPFHSHFVMRKRRNAFVPQPLNDEPAIHHAIIIHDHAATVKEGHAVAAVPQSGGNRGPRNGHRPQT